MGKNAEHEAGAIYRFYKGEIRKLFDRITIPNSICFSPDQPTAFFTDTKTRKIMRQSLETQGWPIGEPEIFVDLNVDGLNPDGSVIDAEGHLLSAQWGASRVARYSPEGTLTSIIEVPATQPSCHAFGGSDLRTLFITSAAEKISNPSQDQGRTYKVALPFKGQAEHQVTL